MLFQGICGYGADSSQSSLVQQFLLIAENLQQVGYGAAAGEGYDACFAAFESFDKLILVFAVGNGFVSSYDVNDTSRATLARASSILSPAVISPARASASSSAL